MKRSHLASSVRKAGELVPVASPEGRPALVSDAFHVDEERLFVETRHDTLNVVPVEEVEIALDQFLFI